MTQRKAAYDNESKCDDIRRPLAPVPPRSVPCRVYGAVASLPAAAAAASQCYVAERGTRVRPRRRTDQASTTAPPEYTTTGWKQRVKWLTVKLSQSVHTTDTPLLFSSNHLHSAYRRQFQLSIIIMLSKTRRRRKLHTRSLIGSCVCHQLKRLKQLQSREHSACRTRKTVPCGQTGNWKIMAVVNAEFMSSYVQFVS